MHVFIAGATGVLGRSLIPLLQQGGHSVRALVRSPVDAAALRRQHIEIVPKDLLAPDVDDWLPVVAAGCDAVIHAATAIPRNPAMLGAWDATARLRTEGTRYLLDAALAIGARCYIQQSIALAYPDSGDTWIDETTLLDTSTTRAPICAPVIVMEALVRAIDPARLAWCILRGGVFVGPGTAQDALLEQLRAGRAVVPGDGRNFISPVHVADMAAAVVAALELAPNGAICNIVDTPLRYGSYVDQLADRLGVARPPRDPALPRQPSYRCSNQMARTILGWAPIHAIWPDLATMRHDGTGTADPASQRGI